MPGKIKKSVVKSKNKLGRRKKIKEFVKTSFLTGLGMAFLGQEMLEKWVKKVAKEHDLSTTDAKSFIRDVKKRSLEARKDMRSRAIKVILPMVKKPKIKEPMAKGPTYNISTSVYGKTLELDLTGEVMAESLQNFVIELYSVVDSMKPEKLLADIHSLKMPREYLEAYSSARDSLPPLCVKTAFVDLPEYADFQEKFNKTMANNTEIPVKILTDIDVARAWLKSRKKS